MTPVAVTDGSDLDLRCLEVTLPARLGQLVTTARTVELSAPGAAAPGSAPA